MTARVIGLLLTTLFGLASLCSGQQDRVGIEDVSGWNKYPGYGTCDINPDSSIFRITSVTETPAAGGNRVCVAIATNPTCPRRKVSTGRDGSTQEVDNPCCVSTAQMPVEPYIMKLEVETPMPLTTCRNSVASAELIVNGTRHRLSQNYDQWPLRGRDRPARGNKVRLVNMNLSASNATGAQVCFTLNSVCPSLEQLCAGGREHCKWTLVKNHYQGGICDCCPVFDNIPVTTLNASTGQQRGSRRNLIRRVQL